MTSLLSLYALLAPYHSNLYNAICTPCKQFIFIYFFLTTYTSISILSHTPLYYKYYHISLPCITWKTSYIWHTYVSLVNFTSTCPHIIIPLISLLWFYSPFTLLHGRFSYNNIKNIIFRKKVSGHNTYMYRPSINCLVIIGFTIYLVSFSIYAYLSIRSFQTQIKQGFFYLSNACSIPLLYGYIPVT